MIINHNITALNTLNKLKKNNKANASVMEKLSSGLRINKASDDSAGLAISQKMKAQIRGLQQAQRNIQDGISLIQTAEGGLGTIQDPNLLRLRELAIQSANDTLTNEDRQEIQKEVEQIKAGINEIANNTHFNGINLLNSSNVTVTGYESTSTIVDLSKVESITVFEITYSTGPIEGTFTVQDLVNGVTWKPDENGGEEYYFSVDLSNNTFTTKANTVSGISGNNIAGVKLNGAEGYEGVDIWASNLISSVGSPEDPNHSPDKILGNNLSEFPNFGINEPVETEITVNFEGKKAIYGDNPPLQLQVGANSGDTFPIELTDARTTALGINNIDLSTRQGAESSISKIDNAMEIVSGERGKFGAYNNRLEHALNNSSSYEMNLTSSESRIADADMAKQMMALTKNQILSQASQAMLSQASQQPQQVLQLLK